MKPKPSFLDLVSIKMRQILFPGSGEFWESRYSLGGNSGGGSYGRLAEFKAEVINRFVKDKNVASVIEFGCGDGNQLTLAKFPQYAGLDVSTTAISLCREKFDRDGTKSFFLYSPFCFLDRQGIFKADLGLSLDVIYHLVEDEIFHTYMNHLFSASEKFVIIYSSDEDRSGGPHARHVRHRNFSRWVGENLPGWSLLERVKNRYPGTGDLGQGSFADFFFFAKTARL